MALTAAQIHGLSESILKANYDNPKPTPPFHREMREVCCSNEKKVALAAPRGHSKSTAITHAYVLANVLFRERKFVLIVSSTEAQSVLFLNDIKNEIMGNEDLRELFGVQKIIKDSETDIIIQFDDGEKFRILAKGSEQKLRGLKWMGKRPDLIVGDDLEDDEQVLNKERREKFRNWFFGALVPSLSDTGIIRVVGTILHFDSLLENLLHNGAWESRRYRAHNEDFSFILWPEQWPEERLRATRQEFTDMGYPEGYSQEYLNYPIDESSALFKKSDILPIKDTEEPLTYYFGGDFAVSKAQTADFTVIAVVGVNSVGRLKVVDIIRGRFDSLETVDELFLAYIKYRPEKIIVERGAIEKAIGPFLYAEMPKRNIYLPLDPQTPTKDKTGRATGIRTRMRAGGVEFDTNADWFPVLEDEILKFPKGKHDDQVDALSWIGLELDKIADAPTVQEIEDEEWEMEFSDEIFSFGRNEHTGY